MNPVPAIIAHVFTQDPCTPIDRLVHLALAAISDEKGHVETTVHTLEHMTGLSALAIEITLGHNLTDMPLFPAAVTLSDGIVLADLEIAS